MILIIYLKVNGRIVVKPPGTNLIGSNTFNKISSCNFNQYSSTDDLGNSGLCMQLIDDGETSINECLLDGGK